MYCLRTPSYHLGYFGRFIVTSVILTNYCGRLEQSLMRSKTTLSTGLEGEYYQPDNHTKDSSLSITHGVLDGRRPHLPPSKWTDLYTRKGKKEGFIREVFIRLL